MEQKNLDIYGHDAIPWSRPLAQLDAQPMAPGSGHTFWLATVGPDQDPHVTAVGALWVEGKIYFTSGARIRKSRNLAHNPRCTFAISLDGIDLVIEGRARKVTDEETLRRITGIYAAGGWPAHVENGAITAEYSAPTAGRPPWDLYEVKPATAVGVATAEPHGATRWTFE